MEPVIEKLSPSLLQTVIAEEETVTSQVEIKNPILLRIFYMFLTKST